MNALKYDGDYYCPGCRKLMDEIKDECVFCGTEIGNDVKELEKVA